MTTVNVARPHPPSSPPSAETGTNAPTRLQSLSSLIILGRFAIVMSVLLAIASFPRSAFFPIRAIQISGTEQVPASEVIARADLKVGDPRFAIRVEDLTDRILRIPRIASADVRVGSDGRIRIAVVERLPYAAITFHEHYVLVDRAGVALEYRQDPANVPVVRLAGAALPWAPLGARVSSPEAIRALDVLGILPAPVLQTGTQLKLQADGDWVLVTADGVTVLLGQPRGLGDRAALLEPLLVAVRSQISTIEYLDLRFAGNVVIKPVGGTQQGRAGVRP